MRFSRSVVVLATRRMAVAAASVRPCTRRNSAKPGWGSRPSWLAPRYASSAAANSPFRRWTSACW